MVEAGASVIRISGEQSRRLDQLAMMRGVSQESLVEEALDRLFRQCGAPDEDISDAELLCRMEAELGPSKARAVPPMDPARFIINHASPIDPGMIRRPSNEH